MRPSSRSQSAATTALTAGIGELFRVKRLREIPQWRILGRCAPPSGVRGAGTGLRGRAGTCSFLYDLPKRCPFYLHMPYLGHAHGHDYRLLQYAPVTPRSDVTSEPCSL